MPAADPNNFLSQLWIHSQIGRISIAKLSASMHTSEAALDCSVQTSLHPSLTILTWFRAPWSTRRWCLSVVQQVLCACKPELLLALLQKWHLLTPLLACRDGLRNTAHSNAATAEMCYNALLERRKRAVTVTTELHKLPPNRWTYHKTHANAYVFKDKWPGSTYQNTTWACQSKQSAPIQECKAANNMYEGIVTNITRQFEQECHWSSAKALIQKWKEFWGQDKITRTHSNSESRFCGCLASLAAQKHEDSELKCIIHMCDRCDYWLNHTQNTSAMIHLPAVCVVCAVIARNVTWHVLDPFDWCSMYKAQVAQGGITSCSLIYEHWLVNLIFWNFLESKCQLCR